MKRIKKILSVMLSLVMLTSVLPLTTFASEENANNLQVAMSDGGSCIMEQDGNSTESSESFETSLTKDSTIKLTFKANDGYHVQALTVNDKEKNIPSDTKEYTYSYTVSESFTSINVVFEESNTVETNEEKPVVDSENNTVNEESNTVESNEEKPVVDSENNTVNSNDDTENTEIDSEDDNSDENEPDMIDGKPNPAKIKSSYTLSGLGDGKLTENNEDGIIVPLNVTTSNFTIKSYGNSMNYCPLGSGSNLKVQLKYINEDWNDTKDFKVDGIQNCRMVYCLQWQKKTPDSSYYPSGGTKLSREILYCLTYGVQYWEKTCEYGPYSTGDWKKDYVVTQLAVHACNKEFGGSIDYNRSYIYSHITDATIKAKFNKMVTDAMEDSNYTGMFSGNNFVGFKYSVTANGATNAWSSSSAGGSAGYITNAYYNQTLEATKWLSTKMQWYITNAGATVTGVSGAKIIWTNSSNHSSFRIWVPKASYEAAQATGATLKATVTCEIPSSFGAWEYMPTPADRQKTTVFEAASTTPTSREVTASIAKVVTNGTLNITKVSSDTVLVKDNNNYSLKNAVFKVYKKGTNTEVKTLTTDANGKASASIAAGTYDVVEVTAPQGYVLDSTRHEVTITSGGTANLSVKNTPKTGKINLAKSSSKPEYTDNNSVYSLKDAVYTVYKKDTKTEVGKITTDKDGKGSLDNLAIGSYDVVETTAPKGFALDATTHSVTVNETNNSVVTIDLKVKDIPQLDPVGVMLKKVDADTMEAVPAGAGTLAGAEFTVKYYDVENYTTDPALDGKKAVRTWVVKTNDKGITRLRDDLLVSGDEFYLDSTGVPTLPLGTITIQESKAPEGYLLNEEVFIIPITSDGTAEGVNTYAIPTIPENALSLNLKKIQSGTDKAISGAVFEHTKPDGTTETMTTDENGELSFAGLAWGEHTVKEISVPDGYSVNTNEIKFTVSEGNVISINSKATETDTNGNVTVTVNKDGNIDAVVEEKPAPYKLRVVKYNDKEKVLSGAEFTLYAEEECNTVVSKSTTDENGVLTLENLIPGKHYYLKETKAPQGYKLPEHGNLYDIYVESTPVNGVFDFTVNGEKFTANSTDTTQNIYLSGSKADRVINMKIVNKIGLLLPETGSNMTIIVIAIGAVLMIFGMVFNKEKKKNKREEKEV